MTIERECGLCGETTEISTENLQISDDQDRFYANCSAEDCHGTPAISKEDVEEEFGFTPDEFREQKRHSNLKQDSKNTEDIEDRGGVGVDDLRSSVEERDREEMKTPLEIYEETIESVAAWGNNKASDSDIETALLNEPNLNYKKKPSPKDLEEWAKTIPGIDSMGEKVADKYRKRLLNAYQAGFLERQDLMETLGGGKIVENTNSNMMDERQVESFGSDIDSMLSEFLGGQQQPQGIDKDVDKDKLLLRLIDEKGGRENIDRGDVDQLVDRVQGNQQRNQGMQTQRNYRENDRYNITRHDGSLVVIDKQTGNIVDTLNNRQNNNRQDSIVEEKLEEFKEELQKRDKMIAQLQEQINNGSQEEEKDFMEQFKEFKEFENEVLQSDGKKETMEAIDKMEEKYNQLAEAVENGIAQNGQKQGQQDKQGVMGANLNSDTINTLAEHGRLDVLENMGLGIPSDPELAKYHTNLKEKEYEYKQRQDEMKHEEKLQRDRWDNIGQIVENVGGLAVEKGSQIVEENMVRDTEDTQTQKQRRQRQRQKQKQRRNQRQNQRNGDEGKNGGRTNQQPRQGQQQLEKIKENSFSEKQLDTIVENVENMQGFPIPVICSNCGETIELDKQEYRDGVDSGEIDCSHCEKTISFSL